MNLFKIYLRNLHNLFNLSIKTLRFKDKPAKNGIIEYHDDLIKILGKIDLQFSTRNGIGLGNVVEFTKNDNKWRGITLVLDSTPVQFYLVSKRGGYQSQKRPDVQFQTVINERYQI